MEQDSAGARLKGNNVSVGYDIYDNQEKLRLKPSYPSRAHAEVACAMMNNGCHNPDELFLPFRTF